MSAGDNQDGERDEELSQFALAVELRAKLDDTVAENRKLHGELAHLRAVQETDRNERDELSQELDDRKARNADILTEMGKVQDVARELENLREEAKQWTDEKNTLKSQVSQLKKRNEKLQSEQVKLRGDLDRYKNAYARWKKHADNLAAAKEEVVRNKREETTATSKKAQEIHAKYRSAVTRLGICELALCLLVLLFFALIVRQALSSPPRPDKAAQEKLSNAKKQISYLRSANQEAEKEIQRLHAALAKTEDEVDKLQEQPGKAEQQKLSSARKEISYLQSAGQEADKEIRRLRAALVKTEGEASKLREEANQSKKAQRKLAEELARFRLQVAEPDDQTSHLTVGVVSSGNDGTGRIRVLYHHPWTGKIANAIVIEIWRGNEKIGEGKVEQFDAKQPEFLVFPVVAKQTKQAKPGDLVRIPKP